MDLAGGAFGLMYPMLRKVLGTENQGTDKEGHKQ